jgi:hypothetical protein
MSVASGFGDKTEEAGAGNQVAVATNGVGLRVPIRRARLNRRLVGIGRSLAVPGALLHLVQPRRQLRQANAGAASTVKLFRRRRRNVVSVKVSAIQRAKRRFNTAKIFAGVASTDTSFRSMRPNAKNTVVSAIHPEKMRFSIAGSCVGAASMARLCRFRWLSAGKGTVNVLLPGKPL